MQTSGRLTKRKIEAAGSEGRDSILWDGEVRGFGVRCRAAGGRYYVVKYRSRRRQRWYTIGRVGVPWTLEAARREALRIIGEVARGDDPASARDALRKDITVGELCDRYLVEAPTLKARRKTSKKASTLATDLGRIERHIKPLLGTLPVQSVTRADVEAFMEDIANGKTRADFRTGKRGRVRVSGGRGTASRTVGLLGGIFSFAIRKGLRPDNPVHGIPRYPDAKRERFLSEDEFRRLGAVLDGAVGSGANPVPVAAVRLLLETGARKSEIVLLRWEDVDLTRGFLKLPDAKSGPRVVTVGDPTRVLLERLARERAGAYVLPGSSPDTPYTGMAKAWQRLRHKAGLDDVRLHDLRHTFASVAAAQGNGLIMIGALLGHSDPKTTLRYTHVADGSRAIAVDGVASYIANAMQVPKAQGPAGRRSTRASRRRAA